MIDASFSLNSISFEFHYYLNCFPLDMVGYVPAAYLQIVGDAPKDFVAETQPVEQQNYDNNQHKFEQNSFQEAETEQQNAAYVRALYDYTATTEEELSFYEGEYIWNFLSKTKLFI